MINESLLKDLQLDSSHIKRDRKTLEVIAISYLESVSHNKEKSDKAFAIAASCFRRAAAHSLLLGDYNNKKVSDHLNAKLLFSKSALAYSKLGLPYSVFISTFTNKSPETWKKFEHWIDLDMSKYQSIIPPLQSIYLLLSNADFQSRENNNDKLISIRRNLEAFRSLPIGILGLSIGLYLDVVDAMNPLNRKKSISLEESVLPFIYVFSFSLKQAMQNKYHWKRLAMPFHPAEPDIFGILLLVNRAMKSMGDMTILKVTENLPLRSDCKEFLKGILQDYDEVDDSQLQ